MPKRSPGEEVIYQWLSTQDRQPFAFQAQAWKAIQAGESGLVNAPTGTGKTYSVFLGALIRFINQHPQDYRKRKNNGLRLLWITPLRALAKDIGRAMSEVFVALDMKWRVGIRNGDTTTAERAKQKKNVPEVLIITPESLHLLIASKDYTELLRTLDMMAVDEWHELMGSKRGVMTQLAITRLVHAQRKLFIDEDGVVAPESVFMQVWGISATIGNLDEAADVLLRPLGDQQWKIIRSRLEKRTQIETILPDEIEKYPWAGHMGLRLIDKVVPIIEASRTTLLFVNTRGQSELWYQRLITVAPQLIGAMALHHGSIEHELRNWVEESLHTEKLKLVVATASLDLGVDFRPVDTVIQVGSPKGIARFLQRAGRSGHQPGEVSKIHFLPTNSLEILEAAAIKLAVEDKVIETIQPPVLSFDVLIQFLCTLAVGDGFRPEDILPEVQATHAFAHLEQKEWEETLAQIRFGGTALSAYDEYRKVEVDEAGIFRIRNRRLALRHRMSIGAIVSEAMMRVKTMTGKYIGSIEESFISKLNVGDVFTLAGRSLELVGTREMTAQVRPVNKKGIMPSWLGGRLALSEIMGVELRKALKMAAHGQSKMVEMEVLQPLLDLQRRLSALPAENELLIEQITTKDGYHLYVYPFEGRLVHEAMAALLAYRIGQLVPITFSIAMNDYGFELLSDQPIPVDDGNADELFSTENLLLDIQRSVNSTEMAKRKFRDIAVIGGLIYQGMPGEQKKARHLQSSASLLFKVFSEYDPDNLLLRQAYQEVYDVQMEEVRLRAALERIGSGKIRITWPERLTPFCFPLKVDSGFMRESLTTEQLADRVARLTAQLEKENGW